MKTSERQTVRRLAPCPPYDVEACESWLGDMAEQGLMLELWGLLDVRFRREEPRPVRYRLTAARLEGNVLFGPPDAPDAGEEALYAETGWHFICRQKEFFIYACDDPAAPELHTDPAVQALSLKMACRSAVYYWIGWLISLAVQVSNFRSLNGILFLVEFPLLNLVFAFCLAWFTLYWLRNLYSIFALRRKLKRGLPPDPHKNWRRSAPLYRCANGVYRLIFPCAIVLLFFVIFRPDKPYYQRTTEEEKAAMPFATMEDLADGAFVLYAEEDDAFYNSMETRRTLLAPRIIEFRERGRIVQGDDVLLDNYLAVDYYEMLTPWLAQKLAPGLYGLDDTYYTQPQTLPALPDVDTARGWRNTDGDRCELILTAGRRAIRITWNDPDGTLGFDRLAPQLAEGFLQGAQPDV